MPRDLLASRDLLADTPQVSTGGDIKRASRAGLGENLLRVGSYASGLPASIAAGIGGGPAAGAGLYATSRAMKMMADRAGLKRLENARNLILNGGSMPTMAERFGTFVRGKLK